MKLEHTSTDEMQHRFPYHVHQLSDITTIRQTNYLTDRLTVVTQQQPFLFNKPTIGSKACPPPPPLTIRYNYG